MRSHKTILIGKFNVYERIDENHMKNNTEKLEEREIMEDKDLISQIVMSERNIKKGKIKELRY